MNPDEWNKIAPSGSTVAWLKCSGEVEKAETLGLAFEHESGIAVVYLVGLSVPVSLASLRPFTPKESA